MCTKLSMTDALERKLVVFAIISRLIVIILQTLFNALIPDHDAGVFSPPRDDGKFILDPIFNFCFRGFKNWDATYFMHITEHGYTYENTLAFFPLFPTIVYITSNTLLFPCQYILSYSNVLMLAAILVNLVAFVQATKYLRRLGWLVLHDHALAYRAALLFCLSPASIFFTAPYSESLFACMCFYAMLKLEQDRYLEAALCIACSIGTRSNGLAMCGFILHRKARHLLLKLVQVESVKDNVLQALKYSLPLLIKEIFVIFGYMLICCFPFVMYQVYSYMLYCDKSLTMDQSESILQYGRHQKYKLVHDEPSPWCHDTVPISYSYVQKHHWKVGFMAYFELKQIPNFMLAAPMVLLAFCAAGVYFRHNRWQCCMLGFGRELSRKHMAEEAKCTKLLARGIDSQDIVVYVLHMMTLLIFGIFAAHIQILTRFLASSTPVIYWFAAYLITPCLGKRRINPEPYLHSRWRNVLIQQIAVWGKQDHNTKLVFIYFLSYSVIGTAMFANSLPWT